MANNTAIRGDQIRDEVADNGLTKDANGNFQVLAGIGSGASNEADVIEVSPNGISVAIDDVSLGENGSNQLYIRPDGVGSTELDTTDNYDFTGSGAGTITVNDPVSDNDVANKAYVDAVASGLIIHQPVRLATVNPLDATYDNGTGGVGATLTNAGAQAALSIDGIAVAANDRIMVKNQEDASGGDAAENGVYVVTDIGSGATNWVLTRAADYDNSPGEEIHDGDFFFIGEGSTQEHDGWVQTTPWPSGSAVGTTDITFVQFSSAGTLTEGAGIDITANVVSVQLYATEVTAAGDSNVNNNPLYLDATNGLNVMVDNSTIDLDAGNDYRLYIPNGGVTETQLNASVAGNGISGGGGTALALDLSELTGAVIDVSADSVPFLDATDGTSKIESVADLMTAVAGAGLTATSGVLDVGAGVGLAVDATELTVVTGFTSGAANLADVLTASVDGVSVGVDTTTIDDNGSGQLEVIDEGITEPKLAVSNAPSDGQVLGWTASGSTMTWIDNDAADAVTEGDFIKNDQSALCNKVTTVFTLTNTPVDASLGVYLNGLLQQEGGGKDYTQTGTAVTFAVAPHTNDILVFMYVEKDT